MQAIIDMNTLLLRCVVPDTTEIIVNDSGVVLPTFHINDMGTRNTAIIKFDGTVPPGMTEDESRSWKANNWQFNPFTKKFEMVGT